MNEAPTPVYQEENRLKGLAVGERPQERLEKHGASALSDTELLAMLLRSGTRGYDVLSLASRLISEAGSLAGLIAWTETDLRRLKGIGRVKALQLLTVMEIARRVLSQQAGDAPLLGSADLIATYFAPIIAGLQVEKFCYLPSEARRSFLRHGVEQPGTPARSIPRSHPRRLPRNRLCSQPSLRLPSP
jgi:DNA repair protein RadC